MKRPQAPRGGPERFADLDSLGVEALGFLAADQDRLGDFLVGSGITHLSLRDAAREPGFLRGVLNHIAADERLLIAFAAHLGARPDHLGQAIARAVGPPLWSST